MFGKSAEKITLTAALLLSVPVILFAAFLFPSGADADSKPYLFYRESLSKLNGGAALVKAYDALYQGIEKHKASITLDGTLTTDYLREVINAVTSDHPELFWVQNGGAYSVNSGHVLSFSPYYYFTETELDAKKAEFDQAVSEFTADITPYMTDYEIEKTIHKAIIEKVSYVSDSDYNQSAFSALVNKKTVCEGYAEAMKYLLDMYGIDSIPVAGVLSDGTEGLHAWLLVKIDGDYYQTDVTWDDSADRTLYRYFNLTDKMMFKDRRYCSGKGYECYKYMPVCDSTAYNYYMLNQKAGKALYVKAGEESSVAFAGIASALLNPIDGFCRFYAENPQAFKTYFSSNLAAIMSEAGLKAGYMSYSLGNEIFITPVLPTSYSLFGTVDYDMDLSTPLTVTISSGGKEIFSKTVSGIGATYVKYGLSEGTYTVTVTDGTASASKNVTISEALAGDDRKFVCDLELNGVSNLPKSKAQFYGAVGDELKLAVKVSYSSELNPVMHYVLDGKEMTTAETDGEFRLENIPFYGITDRLNIYFTAGSDGERLGQPEGLPETYLDYLIVAESQAERAGDNELITLIANIIRFAYELQKCGAAEVKIVPSEIKFMDRALNNYPAKKELLLNDISDTEGSVSGAFVNIFDKAAFVFNFDIPENAGEAYAMVTGPDGTKTYDISDDGSLKLERISPFDYELGYTVSLYVDGQLAGTLSDYSINTYCSRAAGHGVVRAFYNYGAAALSYLENK